MVERDFSTYEDYELLNLMKLNNRGAFEEIYKRHWSSVLISAYNILKDKDACKDIVPQSIQITFHASLHGQLKFLELSIIEGHKELKVTGMHTA